MGARSKIEPRLFRGAIERPLREVPISYKSDFYRLLKDRLGDGYERVLTLPIDHNSPRILNAGGGDSSFDACDAANAFAGLISAHLKGFIKKEGHPVTVWCPNQYLSLYSTAKGDGVIGEAIVGLLRQHRDMLVLSSKKFAGRGCYF